MKKKVLSAVLTIALCLAIIAGSTYALFTSEDNINIAVSSGVVDVEAFILDDIVTYSLGQEQEIAGTFANGGTAKFSVTDEEKVLTLDKMTPGDRVEFTIEITNNSNVAIQYRLLWTIDDGALAEVLVATVGEEETSLAEASTEWALWNNDNGNTINLPVAIELPSTVTNEYQVKPANITFKVEVTQGNTPIVDKWDGESVSIEWYAPEETELVINSAADLAGLVAILDGSAVSLLSDDDAVTDLENVTFENQVIKLGTNIDLQNQLFDPIGSYRNEQVFQGTFDGQGHTIYNLSQNTWELNNGYYYGDLGLGFFACVENATIKNITFDGVSISGESALCGTVAATAFGDCVFENITVKNANVADYQYYAGGIVGWASGNHQYINCTIDESTTIAAQWGDFDNSVGGIIGGAGGTAQIFMKDCTVACRIDAYNDVTSTYQWYAYRRAGMLIGNSGKTQTNESGSTVAAAPQLTCENVTVIYGDWANYTYCEFAGTSWPYVRVQAGVSNSAYSNPRYGHPTDANGNVVVDDDHVHNEGEDHQILCVFDQLYGGGQGVYGCATHEGVTIVYNNKVAD